MNNNELSDTVKCYIAYIFAFFIGFGIFCMGGSYRTIGMGLSSFIIGLYTLISRCFLISKKGTLVKGQEAQLYGIAGIILALFIWFVF